MVRKQASRVELLVDIGSGSVAAALVAFEKNQKPTILASQRNNIPFAIETSFGHFTSAMLRTLERTLTMLRDENKQVPDNIECFLSTPWCVSDTRVSRLASKKEFVVEKDQIDKLIEGEVKIFEDEAKRQFQRLEGEEADLIEAKIVEMKLNGYATPAPFGKRATSFETKTYVSISQRMLLDAIRSRVALTYTSEMNFNSFSLVAYSGVRDMFSHIDTFLSVDVTGETTNVLLSRNGIIEDSYMVPMGRSTLIRKIASKLNTHPDEAQSQFSLFLEGKLASGSAGNIQKISEIYGKEWVDAVIAVTKKLTADKVPPRDVFIVAAFAVTDWFSNLLGEAYLHSFNFTEDTLSVFALRNQVLDKLVLHKVDVSRDAFITLESIFLARIE